MESNLDRSVDIRSKQGRKVMRRKVTPLKVSAAKNYDSCSIAYSAGFGNVHLRQFLAGAGPYTRSSLFSLVMFDMLPVSVLAL